ncbi:MAG: hypothetical protein DRJ67_01130 [Thermoprotei archaeon]|nr:MAG: hypothetical protein DRJ67_01130 [Thermoprotei archaeon]
MSEDEFLKLSREEIRKVAEQVADAILLEEVGIVPVVVDIRDYLDLDELASTAAGVTDPLGQLKQFISNTLNSVASWIADTVSGAVRGFIDGLKGAISNMISGLKDFISDIISGVKSAISGLRGVVEGISDAMASLSKTVSNVLSVVRDLSETVKNVVLKRIYDALQAAGDFLAKLPDRIAKIGDAISGVMRSVGEIVGKISGTLSGLVESFTKALNNALGMLLEVAGDLKARLSGMMESVSGWLSNLGDAISNTFATLQSAMASTLDALSSLATQVGAKLSDILSTIMSKLQDWLSALGESLAEMQARLTGMMESVSGWLSSVGDAFSKLIEGVGNALAGLAKAISDITFNIANTVGNWLSSIGDAFASIQKAFSDFMEVLTRAPERIPEIFTKIVSDIWSNVIKPTYEFIRDHMIKPILDGVAEISENARKGFELIGKTLEGFVNSILKVPELIWANLPGWVREVLTAIPKAISDLAEAVADFFKDPLGKLKGAIDWLAQQIWAMLPDEIKNVIKAIGDGISAFAEGLQDFLKDPIGFIRARFEELARWIWEHLPDEIKGAIIAIQNAWDAFVKGLQDFLRDPIGFIRARLEELAKWIWDHLPDWLKGAIIAIQDAWNAFVQGLQDFIKDPIGFIQRGFTWLAQQIWELLPEPAKEFIERIRDWLVKAWDFLVKLFTQYLPGFFAWLWDEIQKFLKDPLGYIINATIEIAKRVWEAIKGVAEVVWSWIKGVVQSVAQFFLDAFAAVAGAISSAVSAVTAALSKLVSKAFEEGIKMFKPAVEPLAEGLASPYEAGIGELDALIPLVTVTFNLHTLMSATGDALGGVAETIESVQLGGGGEGKGEPLGIGIGGRILAAIRAKIGALIRWIATTLKKKADDIYMATTAALFFWSFEWIRFAMRPLWLNLFRTFGVKTLGYEIPSISESIRIIQRYYPTTLAPELFDYIRDTLYLHGYPAWVYEAVSEPAKQIYETLVKEAEEGFIVVVKDRFGQDRAFPASPFFDIPTASEMCRMMVRDIFKSPEDFSRAILMRGYVPDIAYMYYLLHFRYPSPEKLWDFVSRGLAGLIWFTPSKSAIEEAITEAKRIGAYIPAPPTVFNFDGEKLFGALSAYMKWHDYARFAWMEGFTSDNWIIIDTLADIPTKIDIRWMAKWAIFDFMSAKGIGITTPASDFTKLVENSAANEKVLMDLTLMCRLLQATGLHPYYVPIVAVAETINALADERTLLRTGLLNIYEYGAMDYETLDSLMSELVVASFAVAYYDMTAMKWETGYINLPVAYLPAERKLLALRALMDRYMRIFRDTLHDLEKAYTEYIIDATTVSSKMSQVLEKINEPFAQTSKDIVGRQLQLTLDEAYLDATLAAWDVARDVYTIRRIRSWVYRALGWVIYRVGYGYVTIDDAKRIARTFAEIARLPDVEAEAINRILSEMVGIARREYQREYIPTPLTLATMAEILPAVRAFMDKVFDARGVPEEWRPVWRQYITVKPIVDEVKALLSVVEDLYEYFMIKDNDYDKFLDILRGYGWEEHEIKIRKDRGRVLRWRRAYRELIGTPRELVTMAEYSPRARELALAEVEKRIESLQVDPEVKQFLREMWEEYIRIRPVHNEVQREITELISDYAYGTITWQQFTTLLEELRKWGLDDYEIDAYKFIAYMRRRRYAMAGLAPPPEQGAG